MGWFTSKKRDEDAEKWSALAETEKDKAGSAARTAAEHRGRLASGTSTDREFDRYKAREAEEDRRLAAANAQDFEANAKSSRRWW
ncbi:hypothetical protein ABZ912_20085 [Nonomuraea angiospora]|uniref:hypothetical protein n=1 Tax=Nonomuraea angiospora TaxID=46172 RepID=UPI003402EA04